MRRSDSSTSLSEKTVTEAAYAYLASRMRTVFETRMHLKERGYGAEEIEGVIDELTAMNYLDDYQYALRYYEHNREKRRGMLRAARELQARGVSDEIIRNAGEDFRYENNVDELSDALETAARLEGGSPASIARRLENRGYSRETIFRVLERLREE